MNETVGQIPPKYDMDQVYKQAFSHVRLPYPTLLRESRELGVSPVGSVKKLLGSFRLRSSLSVDYAMPTKIEGWQLPNEPTISLDGGKNIVETKLNRGDRAKNVIEEINLNNYRITIRGVIINETNPDEYPEYDVRRLREICEKAGSLKIENALCSIYNIDLCVVEDFRMFEVVGYIGAQAYEISMLSDEDFELEVIDDPERL